MTGNAQFALILIPLVLAAAAYIVWRNVIKPKQQAATDTKLYDGNPTPTLNFGDVTAWFVGPHPQGGPSRSVGLPLHPEPLADGLWRVRLPAATWPNPQFQLHGVSINAGSLAGKSLLYFKPRVTVPDGGVLRPVSVNAPDPEPVEKPTLPAVMALGMQRTGDDWSAAYNTFELYRFYAKFLEWIGVITGIHEFSVPLDAAALAIDPGNGWTDAQSYSQKDRPADFELCKAQCEDVFIAFGGGSGLEHGIWYDGPAGTEALIDLLDFRIS